LTITLLDPAQYRRTPWKNGGGTSIDIAEKGETWRFGRTPIVAPGPFSDYRGFERVQILVAGRGLVLKTPGVEIDVRTPFRPVRFAGETPVTSHLEAGPVEVVNLIGARGSVDVDLKVLGAGQTLALGPGTHIAYCADGRADLDCRRRRYALAADHGLRIEAAGSTMLACTSGRVVVASIT
jgi:environmental stress-induced protein Ves